MLVIPCRRPLAAAVEAHGRRSTGRTDDEYWSTSTLETAANTSPSELRDLSDHLDLCRRLRGRPFAALCFSNAVDRFLAPRFMTTVAAFVLLGALSMLL